MVPTDEFTARYLAYLPVITGLVRKVIRDAPIEIEDVLQEVWILGRRAYHSLRDPRHFRSWIGRTSINAALMALRTHRRRSREVEFEDEGPGAAMPCPRPLPDETAERGELLRLVKAHAERTPAGFAALLLVAIGMTHKEAADALGVSEGAAKSNAFRVARSIRASLTDLDAA